MKIGFVFLVAVTVAVSACDQNIPLSIPGDGGVTGDAANWIQIATNQNLKDEVDILFMVDDSGSMQPKQQALRERIPQLTAALDSFAANGHPASYHIGVVTSDLGAAGIQCGFNLGGKLQAIGAAAPAGCQGPTNGGHYLVYDQKDHTQDNLPPGQDLSATFTCMATVTDDATVSSGHVGCGFESQLESVYKALHDPIAENAGFLRPEAILVVVFVTDEDDCSTDPTTDLFSNMSSYGNQASYKCTRYGISCDGQFPLPATPMQSFASCAPATQAQGGKLTDVQKYIDFFTNTQAQGGIKADPGDVILATIDGPTMPFGTEGTSDQNLCGQGVSSCTVLSHSCVAPSDASFFGDPAVRINAVITAAQHNHVSSICDTDYGSALDGLSGQIKTALLPACVTAPIANPGSPNCVVADYDQSTGTTTPIPACDLSHSVKPCWAINAAVTDCPKVCDPVDGQNQQLGIDIDRGTGVMAPAGTIANVSCEIVPPGTGSKSCGS